MNKKLVSKLSILALTLTVSTSAIAPTITSAKTLKNLNNSTISKEIIPDISLKYDLNESDMRKVMVSVGFNPRVADLIIDIIDSFFL
ncbi:hypothetical protein AB8I94_003051 [Clostridium perfringens]|uniref:hypothetical protein n=1 Tax=Clostridium perfringens TaxID=1502 RepID=UPI001ABB4620|nr:hypothetical protein [Clostridium perfringens]EIF6296520.1 hypothetical protein [Clostridium perfringens]EIF6298185.1 hypothetical protein [Clostridium perfringens]ELC8404883.1 hypothetical protein [Clostridium perfringens]ELC8405848.1 hypothetical protein [Clostridium perfringens]MBO3365531.1 hypothetical protein [Clostridium perfringens]